MADTKPAKDASTMVFIVVALLLTVVGAGTGLAVGSIMQANTEQGPQPPTGANTKTTDNNVKSPEASTPSDGHGVDKSAAETDVAAGEAQGDPEVLDPRTLKTVAFPPVLTTLAEPKGKWIRLEGSILITGDTEDLPEILAERSGEQILTYLRSLRLDQLDGPTSFLGIREDLTEMLRVLSKGQVKGLLINGLVIE